MNSTLEKSDDLGALLWGEYRQKIDVPQKPVGSIPKPSERPSRWIKYGDSVAFVIKDRKGKIRIRTGHITSTSCSHCGIDNIKRTVVWSDDVLNDLADNADDAYEQSFKVSDPRLLRLDEIAMLKDPEQAIAWFSGVFDSGTAHHISGLLSKPDLGHDGEMKELAAEQKRFQKASDFNMRCWHKHRRPATREELDKILKG